MQHNEATEVLLKETQKGIEGQPLYSPYYYQLLWNVFLSTILETIERRRAELEKIAKEQSQEALPTENIQEDSNAASSKSRNKETLGRELSSNEDSDQD